VPDDWNRTLVEVPAGARQLTVRFEPRWGLALVPAAVLAALGTLVGFGCRRLADPPAAAAAPATSGTAAPAQPTRSPRRRH
jgi:hypothetical protein